MITELTLGLIAGAFLGLLGGGGSVIAVPMLVYAFGLGTKSAIGTALLVVAIASALGAYTQYKAGMVNLRVATIFGITGSITSFVGALIARSLPDAVQMHILAGLMLVSAVAMLFRNRTELGSASTNGLVLSLTTAGFVGLLTGIVGVGGGFILVPALTIFLGLPVAVAIGTSLVIVAANSAIASVTYMPYIPRDFALVIFAIGMSVACPIVGRLATRLNPTTLRRVFSAILVLIACFIFIKEV